MNKTLKFIFGLSVLCASFISCSQKKDTPSSDKSDWYIDQRQSEQMVRTMTDTLAVLYNVKKYLDYQKANELDSALNMLYIPDGDDIRGSMPRFFARLTIYVQSNSTKFQPVIIGIFGTTFDRK